MPYTCVRARPTIMPQSTRHVYISAHFNLNQRGATCTYGTISKPVVCRSWAWCIASWPQPVLKREIHHITRGYSEDAACCMACCWRCGPASMQPAQVASSVPPMGPERQQCMAARHHKGALCTSITTSWIACKRDHMLLRAPQYVDCFDCSPLYAIPCTGCLQVKADDKAAT